MNDKRMQSPMERYYSDMQYKSVVDTITNMLHTAQFTPSEMREAAILASIRYEEMRVRQYHIPMTEELHQELKRFHRIVDALKGEQE